MAKTTADTVPANRRARLVAERERKKQRRRMQWMAAGALAFTLLGALVFVAIQRNRPVGEEQRFATQGNAHIPIGTGADFRYNSAPPTSGPHYPNILQWGVYEEPQLYQYLVHNLEDAGVVLYYQCPEGCPELLAQLEGVANDYLAAGRNVVVAPNDPAWTDQGGQALHSDMGGRIGLAAWRTLDVFDEFDEARIRAFIDRYEGIDHHQG